MPLPLVFNQTFSIINSIIFVASITIVLFTLKFWVFLNHKKNLYNLPSVIIFGNNYENPMITKILGGKASSLSSLNNRNDIMFKVSNFMGKKLQFLEMPFKNLEENDIEFLNKINSKGLVFFDNDHPNGDRSKVLKELEDIKRILGGKVQNQFLVVNKQSDKLNLENGEYEIFEDNDESMNLLRKRLHESIS